MLLSFTTLGCPDWDLDTILSRAVEYGFDAVDFRGCAGEMEIYRLPAFSTEAEQTARRFADAGLKVSCFSSSSRCFSREEERRKHLDEVKRYAELCAIFGTSYIRVFGGGIGDTPRDEAVRIAADHLQEMAEAVRSYGATVILETHDDWTRSEHVAALFGHIDTDAAAVLWDIHHPYRAAGEAPEETWETLGRWIRYTHWKDSFLKDGGHQLCLLGEGDVPLREIYALLRREGYDGYFTLEWEKKWHPEIPEPEVAFPHYVSFMRNLAGQH